MVRANTAYVLNPETRIFKPVELQVDLGIRPLYAIIGCRLLEVVRFDERHTLFVDEEGLQDGLTAFTIFEGFPQPIAGKIVLVGGDGSTPYTSPLISLEDAAKHFKCCRPVLDPVFAKADEISPGGIIIAGALAGLQCRIERRTPTLVEQGFRIWPISRNRMANRTESHREQTLRCSMPVPHMRFPCLVEGEA